MTSWQFFYREDSGWLCNVWELVFKFEYGLRCPGPAEMQTLKKQLVYFQRLLRIEQVLINGVKGRLR